MTSLGIFASPGRYVQGRNATESLGEQLLACGLKGPLLILYDPVARFLKPTWECVLPAAGFDFKVSEFGGECTVEEIDSLAASAKESGTATIIGVGGGKCLDTARAAADLLGLSVVNCPTAASSDAPCSAASVVYTADGTFDQFRTYKTHPALVLMDTSVIMKAPKRLLISGMGDALATYFEARSSCEAYSDNILGGRALTTGLALAELCYRTLLADGVAAVAAVEAGAITPAFERIVEANTLLSGLGFESGGLCVAHAVHNGVTAAPGSHAFLHGEKVSFGNLTMLVLEGRPDQEINQVLDFCVAVGLPITLKQIGVDASNRDLLLKCAERACAPTETSHSEPFKVTPGPVLDAMLAADAIGRKRLAKA